MRSYTYLLILLIIVSPVFSQEENGFFETSMIESEVWILIFSFVSVFSLVFISIARLMRARGEENRILALLISISIAGLSTLFLMNNPLVMEWVSNFYIVFTFLGPILLMIAGLSTIESKKLKIFIVIVFLLAIIYLIFFTGVLDLGGSVTGEDSFLQEYDNTVQGVVIGGVIIALIVGFIALFSFVTGGSAPVYVPGGEGGRTFKRKKEKKEERKKKKKKEGEKRGIGGAGEEDKEVEKLTEKKIPVKKVKKPASKVSEHSARMSRFFDRVFK